MGARTSTLEDVKDEFDFLKSRFCFVLVLSGVVVSVQIFKMETTYRPVTTDSATQHVG